MQIRFVSVMVEDQEQALQFSTSVLGFKKMADIDGPDHYSPLRGHLR